MASRRKNSNLTFGLFGGEGGAEAALHERLAKSHISVRTGIKEEEQDKRPSLTKSILNVLNGSGNSTIERLSFDVDPSDTNSYAGVYKRKLRLLPDEILKRIAIQDSLVSNIVRARQNHVSAFGRPRPDRFSTGFEIKANPGVIDSLDEAGKKKLNEQIERAVKLVSTCGHTEGVDIEDLNTFSEYLSLSTRSAVVNGRIATEIIWLDDESAPEKKKFHRWLAADAGTIYHATNDHSSQESVRDTAYHLISQLAGKKFKEETYNNGDYRWVQVINGKPQQVFTSNEMKVYNFYAVPDVELDGYPVTPLDTVISAIVTHTNITAHNRLYFQSGRASRGMLVIKSDDVNPTVIHNIKPVSYTHLRAHETG
jgi:hypothetical protein